MQLSEADFVRILEATRAITSTLGVADLLQTVMRLASEVVHAEASSLLLLDPATGELYFDVALGEKGGALQRIRLKRGEGIAGWVAERGEPAVVNDVANDPRWTKKGDQASKFKTRAILAVPMVARDKRVGVLEAINRVDGQPFSERDLKVFEFFAAQVATAIETARLFDSIRQEQEKMTTILTQMVEGVILVEPNGRIALANAAALTLLGPKTRGENWKAIEDAFMSRPGWSEMSSVHGYAGPIELMRKAQPALILCGVVTQVRNDRGQILGHLIVLSDVTEERREAMLKKNFLSLVSHKLKTPLVAIRGFAPMLLEKPDLDSFQKTALEAIDRNSILLSTLVEKITWFAALEGGELELTPKLHTVSGVIEAALAEMATVLLQNQAELHCEPSLNSLPPLEFDKPWVKEAFRNIIENAIKFNPKPPKQLTISGSHEGNRVELRFQDNGPGIPSEERMKIFQKFYQIESGFTGQVPGMGLGLALVKRVVESHGGSVDVESAPDQGSTFIVRFLTGPIH